MTLAIAMYVATMFLSSWFSAQFRRRIVGYGFLTDVSVHIILQYMFGDDANGRAGLVIAGVMINVTMHTYRWLRGYERYIRPHKDKDGNYVKGRWARYAGTLT